MRTISFTWLLATILVFIDLSGLAQGYENYPVKEHYDANYQIMAGTSSPIACSVQAEGEAISNAYGDGWCYILESELSMFELTGDQAYLVKFVDDALCIQEHRRDVIGIDQLPLWACQGCNEGPWTYHDGSILWPMAHFVYMVEVQNPLWGSIPLPQIPNTKITNNIFGGPFATYAAFSQWLRPRLEQTLDYYTYGGFWIDDDKCYSQHQNSDFPMEINKQAGFGCALYYLGMYHFEISGYSDYLNKAGHMATKLFGTVDDESGCQLVLGEWINIGFTSRDVLENGPNTSFIWQSNGWQPQTCDGQHGSRPDDYEDLSHGFQTLRFPLAIENRFIDGSGNQYFGDPQMLAFRNTMSYNICPGYVNGCPLIHAGVDGNDEITYRINDQGVHDYDGVNNPIMTEAALQWATLSPWDAQGSGTNVYTIMMDLYACRFMGNLGAVIHSIALNGLAEVTTAQWANECVNVTFYNRDLVYNQDFSIKNRLTIAPEANTPYHQPGYPSFADPVITTNEFIIEPNVTSNMTAGEEIILGPGFIAKEGCNFTASINSSACTDGQRMGNPQPQIVQPVYVVRDIPATPAQTLTRLSVVPNPAKEEATLEFSLKTPGKVTVLVTDVLGRTMFNEVNDMQSDAGNYSIHLDLSSYAAGVYSCSLIVDGQLQDVTKLVVE